jgi:hypothetical protein
MQMWPGRVQSWCRCDKGEPSLSHAFLPPIHARRDYVGLDTMLFILEGWVRDYPGNPAFFVPKSLKDKVAAVSEQLQSQHRALACSALALSHTTQRTPVIITPFSIQHSCRVTTQHTPRLRCAHASLRSETADCAGFAPPHDSLHALHAPVARQSCATLGTTLELGSG